MFKRYKKIKRLKKQYKEKEIILNDKNEAIIDVYIQDFSSAISPFSIASHPVINGEFASFLNQHLLATHLRHNIEIKITSPSLNTKEEIDLIKQAINNYYLDESIIINHKIKKNWLVSITFIILTILIFAFVVVCDYLKLLPNIILELFDIAGWVFMWEAVDLLFLERPINQFELLKSQKILNANISIETNN